MNTEEMKEFIIHEDAKLVMAMQMLDSNSKGILFVVNQRLQLCGSLTDGDIRRWLLKTAVLDTAVSSVMNPSPQYLHVSDWEISHKFPSGPQVYAVPLVDERLKITDIIWKNKSDAVGIKKSKILEDVPVIIMAGGKGTRLYPYTKILPKPLIPIGNIPIVERIMDYYHDFGIAVFWMIVNYRKNMIRSYFTETEKKYEIKFVEEENLMGTAGGIKLIKKRFDKPLFVTNCDTLIRADYTELYEFHKKSGNAVTVVAATKNDTIPYGVIYSKENGEIEQLLEKPTRSYLINTGMYIVDPEVIELIPDDTLFHMTDLVNTAMVGGLKVGMYPVSENSFLDMGEFGEMRRMEEKLQLS